MIKFSPDTDAAEAPVPLTMAMRALLRKMDETGLPLTPSSSGNGYMLVTRSVLSGGGRLHFWTPLHVGRMAFELG